MRHPDFHPATMDAESLAAQHFNAGNRLLTAGRAAEAEARFREAIRLAPTLAEPWVNLGLLLEARGAVAEAEASYRQALALDPLRAQAHLNLGALLAAAKRFDEAELAYRRALELDARAPAAWSNLGVLHASLKHEALAEACYREALSLDPHYAKARFNLAYLRLRQGDFEEGWACLEARDWYATLATHLPFPRWSGEPLAGKSMLIGFEAGHGDMIQFCRYADVLKTRGAARIGLLCHPALVELFRSLAAVDTLISFDDELPESGWDFWSPPLSLPHHCGTRVDTIPAELPYLHADPVRIAHWAPRIPRVPRDGLRIGLVWKGNPRFENDADRSLPSLATLAPLAALPGVRYVSLQKGAGEEEALSPPPSLDLCHLGSDIHDFADTAAIVTQLDLVICVDTALAHLAGALGKPCWVLLPDYKADWRWLTARIDSPWYPGVMRLFRQQRAGDWAPTVAAVRDALAAWSQQGG